MEKSEACTIRIMSTNYTNLLPFLTQQSTTKIEHYWTRELPVKLTWFVEKVATRMSKISK